MEKYIRLCFVFSGGALAFTFTKTIEEIVSICVKFQNLIDVFVQNILLQKLEDRLTSNTNKHKNLNLHNKAEHLSNDRWDTPVISSHE